MEGFLHSTTRISISPSSSRWWTSTSSLYLIDRQVWPALQDWVPAHQGWLLDKHAPERVQLPGGRSVKVVYRHQAKPKISVLIQHLFGVRETPCFAEGRMPLVVEILAPNHRPIQLTEDLAGFWAGSYAGVRAQLRGRYPKHDWPEPG